MGGRRMAEALKSLSSAPEAADEPRLVGLLAEFEDVDTLVAACRALREAGFREVEHRSLPHDIINHYYTARKAGST